MKRKVWLAIIPLVILLAAGVIFRGDLREAWGKWNAPKLPAAQKFHASEGGESVSADTGLVEGGVATSEHYTIISSPPSVPKPVDPFIVKGPLPSEANLDVPFTSQAPTGDWAFPYQEACEEASAIMVDGYYHNRSGKIPADEATKQIDAIVDYENKTLGGYKDTDAADTAKFITGFFHYPDSVIKPITGPDDIKRAVANGYPVIVPAAGKLLSNPNFRNGGPLYHMLVVKGYTATRFITNDPGTRLGADFTYTYDGLLNAAHDWNGGDVIHGAKVMLVIIPNASR